MRKLFVTISVLAIAVMLSGCTCCNFSSNISTGFTTDTFSVGGNSYEQKDISLIKGKTLNYSVSSSDIPVNVYIMDEPNFNLYEANSNSWNALLTARADLKTSGTYTAPEDGTYYFIVENDGNRTTSVTWDLKW